MNAQTMTLAGMREGAVEQLFQRALADVVENLDDVNTDPKAKRRISLVFTFTTNQERDIVAVDVQSATKLAVTNPVQAVVHVVRRDGRSGLVEPLHQEALDLKGGGPSGLVRGGGA